jgi:hypothetical protein
LINTICENSLIAGYAKRNSAITPQIVQGVATELRLGHTSTDSDNGSLPLQSDDKELLTAVATLLKLRARLKEDEVDTTLSNPLANRLSKHEPYI